MKRAFTLVEALVTVAILFIVVGLLWPVLSRPRPDRGSLRCQSNLKQIWLGFMQYAQDNDERFSPARVTSTKGWMDGLQPYVKSWQMFYCPSAVRPTVASKTVGFSPVDYFYNRRLARETRDKIGPPAFSIMAGDGIVNGTVWSSLDALPVDAATNPRSPAQRHATNALVGAGRAANYLFVDGHVKLLRPDQISNSSLKPDMTEPTFAAR
ncbi:hypothetical protein IAD21_03425 [Abditibacteriota bacterium]|nr:hypothetical protein IAD21_03425 [Abditibacteriota bacterium]